MTTSGIETSGGDPDFVLFSTFYSCPRGYKFLAGSRPHSIVGNIFHTCSTSAIEASATTTLTDISFNDFYNCGTDVSNCVKSIGNITSDPLFTNAASGDFTVQTGSPVLNAGYALSNSGLTGSYPNNMGVDQDDNTTSTHSFVSFG
jgi:hypothetical protein